MGRLAAAVLTVTGFAVAGLVTFGQAPDPPPQLSRPAPMSFDAEYPLVCMVDLDCLLGMIDPK